MTSLKIQTSQKFRRIERWGLLWLLILCAGSSVWRSTPLILGTLLGGLLILINFHLLQSIIRKLLTQKSSSSGSGKGMFLLLGKFFALTGLVVLCVLLFKVNVPGLTLGISTLFLALFSESLQCLWKGESRHGA